MIPKPVVVLVLEVGGGDRQLPPIIGTTVSCSCLPVAMDADGVAMDTEEEETTLAAAEPEMGVAEVGVLVVVVDVDDTLVDVLHGCIAGIHGEEVVAMVVVAVAEGGKKEPPMEQDRGGEPNCKERSSLMSTVCECLIYS